MLTTESLMNDDSASPNLWRENLEKAQHYKNQGNDKYKKSEYKMAIGQYHRALLYLKAIDASQKNPAAAILGQGSSTPLSPQLRHDVNRLYADCQSNLAACMLQVSEPSYDRVLDCCKEAIERVPENVKAHYRCGVALFHLCRYDDAVAALQKAAELQGKTDANIVRYLALCRKRLSEQDERMRDQCKAMFSRR